MPARGYSAVASDGDRFSAGEIAVWGGIVAGTVNDFAGALETGPERRVYSRVVAYPGKTPARQK